MTDVLRRAVGRGGHLFLGTASSLADTESMLTVSRRFGIQRSIGPPARFGAAVAAVFEAGRSLAWSKITGASLEWTQPLPAGTPIERFAERFGDDRLATDAAAVLRGQVVLDREVHGRESRPYLRRLSAYPGGVLVSLLSAGERPDALATMDAISEDFERQVAVRRRQSMLLNDALRIANRVESFSDALRESLASLCTIFGWPLGHVWLRGGADGDFADGGIWERRPRAAFSRFSQASRRLRFRAGPTALGSAAESDKPVWIGDVTRDPELCRCAEELLDAGITSALLLPIRRGETVIGILELFATDPAVPPGVISDGLAELGTQLGLIHEREQSHRAMRRFASERLLAEQRERNRLARDLHDDLGQVLALARMRVESLRPALPDHVASIDQISSLLERANETVRSFSFRLSPPVLHELGLVPALEWLEETLPRPPGMRIEVRSSPGDLGWLSESDRVIVFRSVRELLINAVKHSDARLVTVDVRGGKSLASIAVADDGVGLAAPASPEPKGFGLTSVRESIASLGGRLVLSNRAGGGTRATLRFPVRKEAP